MTDAARRQFAEGSDAFTKAADRDETSLVTFHDRVEAYFATPVLLRRRQHSQTVDGVKLRVGRNLQRGDTAPLDAPAISAILRSWLYHGSNVMTAVGEAARLAADESPDYGSVASWRAPCAIPSH